MGAIESLALKTAFELRSSEWEPGNAATVCIEWRRGRAGDSESMNPGSPVLLSAAVRTSATADGPCAAVAGVPTLRRCKHLITFTIEHTHLNNGAINLGLLDATVPFSSTSGGQSWAVNFCTGQLWAFQEPYARGGARLMLLNGFCVFDLENGTRVHFWVDMDAGLFALAAPETLTPLVVGCKPHERLLPAAVRPFARLFQHGDRVSFAHERLAEFPAHVAAAVSRWARGPRVLDVIYVSSVSRT